MVSGIYSIENIITKKKYIGQARNIKSRWERHRIDLSLNRHFNPYLQNSWNVYGKDAFVFKIIEVVYDKRKRNKREIYWIKELHSHVSENGYNILWGGMFHKFLKTPTCKKTKRR